ncbi:WXG100 family type VII secretion target, partial [Streptomyces cinerochromogenes]|uniref:WXG100 family type VII secretion target n=1 Tax=Streptomyces cinerochromogenes TaxID=66422 RepID=UPI0036C50C95
MPDYNQGGFHDDGTGIYVDPTVQGSPSDYDTWDWKQIMAAITGGSALVPGQGGDARASSVSSPQTLVKAANDFQYVQQIMAMVAKSLTDQAKALAGGDGAPWQGGAADAFMDAMTTFSKQVASNAEALGGGSTGSSVAQNLIWSANALTVAQANIHSIDAWYANQAARFGVKPMANGLMPISQKPELVRMMTDDMRAELKKLASNYAQVNQTLGRVQPKPVVSPAKDPGSTGGHNSTDDTKFPSGSYEGGGSGGSGGPDLSTTGGGGSGGGTSTPDFSSLNTGGGGEGGTVSPFPGGTGMPDLATTGGGGTGDPGGTGTIAPFPGGTSTGGLGTGSGGTTAPESPEVPQLNIPDTGTAGGSGGTVDPFTGGATTPDLPTSTTGTGTVEPFPGSTGTGTGTGTVEPFPGSTGTGTGTVEPFPGSTSAVPLPGFGSVTGPSTGNTGSSTAGQGLAEPVTAWTGGTQPPELQTGGTGTALPETGGTGTAALPNDLVTGAPGLGTPTAMPTSNLVSAPGLPGTSENGAGMPMMPMSPGMGAPAGAGQGAGAAERPDASGLLEGGVKPWTGGAELGALPEVEPVA